MINNVDEISIALAKACGIPTDRLRSISFSHEAGVGVGYVTTEHYVWDADASEFETIRQTWIPVEAP